MSNSHSTAHVRIGELVVAVGSDDDIQSGLPQYIPGFSTFDVNFIHFLNIKGIGHGIKMLQPYLNHINHLSVAEFWFDSEYSHPMIYIRGSCSRPPAVAL